MNRTTLARLQLLAAALLFSTGGAAIKATTLTSWQVAGFRSGMAALAMGLMAPGARGRWSHRTVLVGSAYAATLILFVVANKLTTAANSVFLQATAPLYIVLLAPWILGERLRLREVPFIALLGAGMALFFLGATPAAATAPRPALGNLLAASSGLSWAITVMGLRWIGRREPGAGGTRTTAFAGNVLAFLVCLPWALPVESSRPADWLVIVYLGVFQVGLAYVFLTAAVRSVTALEVSLLLLAEPALNPIWAWLAHGEEPGRWAIAGGILILATTTAKALGETARGPRERAAQAIP